MGKKTKEIFYQEARQAILKAVDRIYDAVRLSMGPAGGNALLFGVFGRSHRICNDGVTIAAVIEPKNEFEELATAAIKDAAKRTNEQAGDATTCTIVIAGKLIRSIFRDLDDTPSLLGMSASKSVMDIRRDLLKAGAETEEKIKSVSKKVESEEELRKIAIVSIESEELGKMVSEMSWKIGLDGFIVVNEGFGGKVTHEVIEGARFPAKVPGKGFINNPQRMEMVAEDVSVILTNYELKNTIELAKALEEILKTHVKLAILAPEFSQDVLNILWKANYKSLGRGAVEKTGVEIYPIKTPSLRTEQWEDLEVYFGAKFIDKKKGQKLLAIDESCLGFAEKIVVKDSETRDDATALGGKGSRKGGAIIGNQLSSAVQERIGNLRKSIEVTREEQDKNLIRQRIASLGSSVGMIRVSADSDAETYYLKKKIEDGVYACRAALEEGYVRGGGLCLKEISESIDNKYLKEALRAPYEQIQENAGKLEIGEDILDATKAIRLAVKHAVSVAASLSTVKVIIAEERDEQPWEAHGKVAQSILTFARYWARREGILDENKEEIEKDRMAREDIILRHTPD